VVRDEKDDIILAAAVGGNAKYLITGDDDLLTLKIYRDIRMISPVDLLQLLEE